MKPVSDGVIDVAERLYETLDKDFLVDRLMKELYIETAPVQDDLKMEAIGIMREAVEVCIINFQRESQQLTFGIRISPDVQLPHEISIEIRELVMKRIYYAVIPIGSIPLSDLEIADTRGLLTVRLKDEVCI